MEEQAAASRVPMGQCVRAWAEVEDAPVTTASARHPEKSFTTGFGFASGCLPPPILPLGLKTQLK